MGYAASRRKRKLIEEAFAWAKTIAGLGKVKVRGLPASANPVKNPTKAFPHHDRYLSSLLAQWGRSKRFDEELRLPDGELTVGSRQRAQIKASKRRARRNSS